MARKNRDSHKKTENEKEYNPFFQIVLKEKKTEVRVNGKTGANTKDRKTEKIIVTDRVRPQDVVKGYDPSASFADILSSFEHTGNPYALKKPKLSSTAKNGTSFADIFSKWENGKVKNDRKAVPKSVYSPKKSFSEILSEYDSSLSEQENRNQIKNKKSKALRGVDEILENYETVSSSSEKPKVKEEEGIRTLSHDNFFRKYDDVERSKEASWSVLGNNDSFVRKTEKKAEKPEEKEAYKRVSVPFESKMDFSQILDKFEEKNKKTKAPEIREKEDKQNKSTNGKSFFRSETEEEKRSPDAAWSIYGMNDQFKRKLSSDPHEITGKPVKKQRSNNSFSAVKSGFMENNTDKLIEEKTFEERLKEKESTETEFPRISISRLRSMLPEATLDLHGENVKDAEKLVKAFIEDAHNHKLRKISIITGKGLHSQNGISVLKEEVGKVLEKSKYIQEKNNAPQNAGGDGAIWIILKAGKDL